MDLQLLYKKTMTKINFAASQMWWFGVFPWIYHLKRNIFGLLVGQNKNWLNVNRETGKMWLDWDNHCARHFLTIKTSRTTCKEKKEIQGGSQASPFWTEGYSWLMPSLREIKWDRKSALLMLGALSWQCFPHVKFLMWKYRPYYHNRLLLIFSHIQLYKMHKIKSCTCINVYLSRNNNILLSILLHFKLNSSIYVLCVTHFF